MLAPPDGRDAFLGQGGRRAETARVGVRAARVAWYRFRVTFARRWSGYLGVVVLVALIGGVAMAAIAGARRTQSSYPALLASSNPSDLNVASFGTGTIPTSSNLGFTLSTASMRRLAGVREVHSVDTFTMAPVLPSGAPDLSTGPDLQTAGSVDGFGWVQDRFAVLQGALPPMSSTNEFVATALAAQLLHLHVGQSLTWGEYTPAQSELSGYGTAKVPPHRTVRATLAAVVVLTNQVLEDDIDRYPTFVIFPPGFTREFAADTTATVYGLALTDGAAGVARVEQEFVNAVPKGSTYTFHSASVIEGRVERAVRPESIALGTFGAIAGAAALAIVGLAVARSVQRHENDVGVLRAIGASRATVVLDQVLGVVGATLLGAFAAGAVAFGLSPLAPLGPVRPVYPHRGLDADWTVLIVGAVLLAAIGLLSATVAGLRSYRHHIGLARDAVKPRPSATTQTAAAAGLPLPVLIGMRFALESDAGRVRVPVRSAIVGAVIAVITVVATMTFGSSLHTLVTKPNLYGWNWTYLLNATNDVPPATLAELGTDPDVAAYVGWGETEFSVDGRNVPTLITDVTDSPLPEQLSPPILSGHALAANSQIVLGPETLAQLHKHVGDTVVVSYGAPSDAPVYLPPTRLVVVGAATMPAIGYSSVIADHTSMGTGAIVSSGLAPKQFASASVVADPNFDGPQIVAVRMQPSLSAKAAQADIDRITKDANHVFAADPGGQGNLVYAQGVQRPAEIVNYRSTGATPVVLAGGLAAGAVISLALTLLSSVRRRRRELAVLKVLGFTRRQVTAVVMVQGIVPALIGVAIGIPAGVAVGRLLWIAFAHTIYVVPQPTFSPAALALVGVGVIGFAALVGILPGWIAARTRLAAALRAE